MHPIDAFARRRALDPRTSFLVQAPAGSGKTELLIQRYLRLLSVVEQPENIVAITFTKKAAAEMRARVIEALRRAFEEPASEHEHVTRELAAAALSHDRDKDWRLEENPSRMRIATIDSLCLGLAARMPWMARLGAMPLIEERAADLYREAARRTVEMVEEAGPVAATLRTLLLHLDNNAGELVNLLAGMLEKREQWLRIAGVQRDEFDLQQVRSSLEKILTRIVTEHLHRTRLLAGDLAADFVRFARCSGNLQSESLPGATGDDHPSWVRLAGFLLTQDGDWRKVVNRTQGIHRQHPLRKECLEFFLGLQGEHEELRKALHGIRSLPPARFTDTQWNALCAVFPVLSAAAGQLGVTFAERGRIDFAELLLSALRAIGTKENPTDLALAVGCRIEHILLDEFQDTSRSQFDLLERLTAGWSPGDGRTLFLVGDPMQSIYRFRQADVGLFLRAREEGVGTVLLEPLTLEANFRSQPAIVGWVNNAFPAIMPATGDATSGAVPYSPSVAASPEMGAPPAVHVFFGASRDEEADRVLSLIRKSAGTTAILVRARNHLTRIIARLRAAGQAFEAIEIHQLGEQPIIQDLMALTFALLHPADRVSWLAILRAPWCGLTLADLHVIACCDERRPVWSLVDEALPRMSGDGAARLARIRTAIDSALRERGRRTLRELVEGAWLLLGGPAFAASESDIEDGAAYFDLLESVDDGGDLKSFTNLRERVAELFAQPSAQAGGRLQVMTIHKAKGLQFDNVILPQLGAGGNDRLDDLLIWSELSDDGLLIAAKPETGTDNDSLYSYVGSLEQEKCKNETARLLYVAATRARRELHLLGSVEIGQKDGTWSCKTPESGSFLKVLWPVVEGQFADELARRTTEIAQVQASSQPIRTIRRVELSWRAPAPPPAVAWDREEAPPAEERDVTFEWVGDTLRHVGTVLHGWLARIAVEGIARWDEARVRSLQPAARAALAGLGVSPAELDSAAETVVFGLLNCIGDKRGRWILSHYGEAQCECELTGWLDGRYYRVRIDRTFVDAEGVRWLIDYKTSAHEGGGVLAFLENEQRRYRDQLERYARLISQMDGRPVRVGLYFPLLGGWLDWEPLAEVVEGIGVDAR